MVPVRSCLPSVLSGLLRRQPLSPAKVAFAWRMAVGPAVDRASSVMLTPDGILEVRTTAAAWRGELERSADIVRARLDGLLGPDIVRRIVIM